MELDCSSADPESRRLFWIIQHVPVHHKDRLHLEEGALGGSQNKMLKDLTHSWWFEENKGAKSQSMWAATEPTQSEQKATQLCQYPGFSLVGPVSDSWSVEL